MKPVLLLIPGMFNPPAVFDGLLPHLTDAFEVRVASVTTQSSMAEMAEDAWALVADVLPPRRLVVGSHHDKVVPPAYSEELAALVSQAELVWMDECGHFAPLEQPAQLSQLLRRLA